MRKGKKNMRKEKKYEERKKKLQNPHHRGDIVEGERLVIFVDDVGFDFFADDFAEDRVAALLGGGRGGVTSGGGIAFAAFLLRLHRGEEQYFLDVVVV